MAEVVRILLNVKPGLSEDRLREIIESTGLPKALWGIVLENMNMAGVGYKNEEHAQQAINSLPIMFPEEIEDAFPDFSFTFNYPE